MDSMQLPLNIANNLATSGVTFTAPKMLTLAMTANIDIARHRDIYFRLITPFQDNDRFLKTLTISNKM